MAASPDGRCGRGEGDDAGEEEAEEDANEEGEGGGYAPELVGDGGGVEGHGCTRQIGRAHV